MSRIISPGNLYSKISEFLFLFNHMHEFLHFYLFISGVYTQSLAFGMKVEARLLSIYFQQPREVFHANDEEIR